MELDHAFGDRESDPAPFYFIPGSQRLEHLKDLGVIPGVDSRAIVRHNEFVHVAQVSPRDRDISIEPVVMFDGILDQVLEYLLHSIGIGMEDRHGELNVNAKLFRWMKTFQNAMD